MTTGAETIKATIVSWEKLRIVYNLVLLGEGLLISWDLYVDFGGIVPYAFWTAVYGATANAFFSLGVLAEIYLQCFRGWYPSKYRMQVFIAGLLFSMAVTLVLAFLTSFSFHPNVFVD